MLQKNDEEHMCQWGSGSLPLGILQLISQIQIIGLYYFNGHIVPRISMPYHPHPLQNKE